MKTWNTVALVLFILLGSAGYGQTKRSGKFPTLHYDTDHYDIPSDSTVKTIVRYLNKYPKVSLLIQGHTDSEGSEAYNMELSEKRARVIYDYLVNKGVPAKRLRYEGLGESQPLKPNTDASGKAANRRVELTLKAANSGTKRPSDLPANYKVQGTVRVDSPTVKFRIFDSGEIDGDVVTLLLNGDTLAVDVAVTKDYKYFELTNLKEGPNWIGLIAVNEGRVGAATLAMNIHDFDNPANIVFYASEEQPGAFLINYNP